jgi:glycosyltransferase involved in cell wall biosynthesis
MDTNTNIPLISIVIPNLNGASTLRQCLSAATTLDDSAYEVIVVDDGSQDNSVDIIKEFPCRLIQLDQQTGASRARNMGAENSHGEILFFTDSDCVIQPGTLTKIRHRLDAHSSEIVLGGTYTPQPYDNRFFSRFQSVFINHSETRNPLTPDYLASHALAIKATTFRNNGGFAEDFLPILEDVEFSHRLRETGNQLLIDPQLQVRHIFNYSLIDSLRNAYRKTKYWVMYSIQKHDLFTDSGTASHELKVNVICFYLSLLTLIIMAGNSNPLIFTGIGVLVIFNLIINRNLFRAFYNANGSLFAVGASMYYLLAYPFPIGAGIVFGIGKLQWIRGNTR